jgi:hypothetical protein
MDSGGIHLTGSNDLDWTLHYKQISHIPLTYYKLNNELVSESLFTSLQCLDAAFISYLFLIQDTTETSVMAL